MKKGIARWTALCATAGLTLVNANAVMAAPTGDGIDTSMVGTTGFAQCSAYVNIRSSADTEGTVVGTISHNGSMEILDVDAYGWYHVRSGNVEGYVASQYVATGSAAQSISETAGYTTAEVGAEVLNVRASASSDSDIVATVSGSSQIEVVEDGGDWIKVCIDANTYGYVSSDYVYTSTTYATAHTVEEGPVSSGTESYNNSYSYTDNNSYSYTANSSNTSSGNAQSVADEKYQIYLAAQAEADAACSGSDESLVYSTAAAAQAAYAAYVSAQNAADETSYNTAYTQSYTDNGNTTASYTYTSTSSGNTQSVADEKYQIYLAAQAEADAACSGSDESLVYSTAAAAQAAYAAYISAQNAADEAAYTQSYTDTSYTDASYADYTEDSYTETYEEPAPSYSSVGQQIADYACQFVGNPYVWGGSSLTGGADCSGFTMSVLANFGVGLPHNAAAQSGYGTPVDLGSIQPGDLLFYNGDGGIGHVSIYIGNGQVVHASNPTNGILISSYNYRTPCSARRFV